VAARRRLDAELVRRSLVESRSQAERLIADGLILVSGSVASKPSRMVDPAEPIEVVERPRFVSRGGEKLDAALSQFALDVEGLRALDCGASTGGFTDCLLQRGAAQVIAVDVGHGQLHPRIRHDERVRVFERLHVRDLTLDVTDGPVDVVVADLSFTSLRSLVLPMRGVCRQGGSLVLLVKPQFEAGRADVSRGRGVITDPALHQAACEGVGAALEAAGCRVEGWITSPITGGEGNVEFLVRATAGAA
jgi:23S rRNA (cytidine1920-2'-O)/16S rRNA (cytidine1409-2'-O)-methyltransferase